MTLHVCRSRVVGAISALCLAGLSLSQPAAATDDPQRIELQQGQTADAYFEVNVSGRIYVAIASKPGDSPCVEFWWIKWPFGNTESLGRHCNFATFEIPGIASFAISAKLRVGGSSNLVKLAVSASESVAHAATFHF